MEAPVKQYGLCLQTYIPVRSDPYERAEMVTQILFGEYVEILDDEGKWLYIKMLYDDYEGWIDKKCIETAASISETSYISISSGFYVRNINSTEKIVIAIGSSFPAPEGSIISLGDKQFELSDVDKIIQPGCNNKLEDIIGEVAGLPYLWGGRSGFGFDCSGLVQYLAGVCGIKIARDASEQAAEGETLSFINEAKAGDLAFFDDVDGMIHHVGMMLGNGRIIHASGTVRIDTIDQQGIFNEKIGEYTHKLRVLKRIIK